MSARSDYLTATNEWLARVRKSCSFIPEECFQSHVRTFADLSMWLSDKNESGWCEEALRGWKLK